MSKRFILASIGAFFILSACTGSNSGSADEFSGDAGLPCGTTGNEANGGIASSECSVPNPIISADVPDDFEPNANNMQIPNSSTLPNDLATGSATAGLNDFGFGAGTNPFGSSFNLNSPDQLAAVRNNPAFAPLLKAYFGGEDIPADFLKRLAYWLKNSPRLPSPLRLRVLVTASQTNGLVRVYRVPANLQPVQIAAFYPFGNTTPVNVAFGDVTGDGIGDVVAAQGSGGNLVRIFRGVISGPQGLAFVYSGGFIPYPGFTGGTNVAVGDMNGDGRMDIITGAGPGGGPHVKIFSGLGHFLQATHSFFAYGSTFTGGVRVGVADMDGDRRPDLVTGAGHGGGPHVIVWKTLGTSGTPSVIRSFMAYDQAFRGGVFVAGSDFNADGVGDIVTGAGKDGGPHIRIFSGKNLGTIASQFSHADSLRHGISVTAGFLAPDDRRPVLVAAPATEGNSPVMLFQLNGKVGPLQPRSQFYSSPGHGLSISGGVSF